MGLYVRQKTPFVVCGDLHPAIQRTMPGIQKEEGGLLSRPLLFQDVFPLSVNDKLFNNLVFVVHDDNRIHATADRT